MNRDALVQMFKDNNVQGILYMEYLEHSNLDKQTYNWFEHFMLKIQFQLKLGGLDYNNYINYVVSEIRNKYNLMFVFNKQDQVIKIY